MVKNINVNSDNPFGDIKTKINGSEEYKNAFQKYFPNANGSGEYDPFTDQDLSEEIKERFINNSTSEQNISKIIRLLTPDRITELADTGTLLQRQVVAGYFRLYQNEEALSISVWDPYARVRISLASNRNIARFPEDVIRRLAGDTNRNVVNALKGNEEYDNIQYDLEDDFLPNHQLNNNEHTG